MDSTPKGRVDIWRPLQELVIHSIQLTAIIPGCTCLEVFTKSSPNSTPKHLPGQSPKRQKNQSSSSSPLHFFRTPKSARLASSNQLRNTGHFLSQHSSVHEGDGQRKLPFSPSALLFHAHGKSNVHTSSQAYPPPSRVLPCHLCQRRDEKAEVTL